jgi:hypothetical protein
VVIGLIETTLEAGNGNWPEEVKENFEEKVNQVGEFMHDQVLEFMAFGQAFDDSDDEDT